MLKSYVIHKRFFFRSCLKSLSDTSMKECNDSGDDGDYKLNLINSPEEMKLYQCLQQDISQI